MQVKQKMEAWGGFHLASYRNMRQAVSPEEFARKLAARFSDADTKQSQRVLHDLLTDLRSLGISEEAAIFRGDKRRDIIRLTDESLMIVQINRG